MKKAIVLDERELIYLIEKETEKLGVNSVELSNNGVEDILILDIDKDCNKTELALRLGEYDIIDNNKISIELFFLGKYICRKNNLEFTGEYKFLFDKNKLEIIFYNK